MRADKVKVIFAGQDNGEKWQAAIANKSFQHQDHLR
jgi:hypothetical protein